MRRTSPVRWTGPLNIAPNKLPKVFEDLGLLPFVVVFSILVQDLTTGLLIRLRLTRAGRSPSDEARPAR
ncbi:MAG: hypothetical protein ACHRXM_33010 [Isosphaerales bacterium]